MAKDTLLQSQQHIAPKEREANARVDDVNREAGQAATQGVQAYLQTLAAIDRHKMNAAETALAGAKLQDYQNQNLAFQSELMTRQQLAQTRVLEAQAHAKIAQLKAKDAEEGYLPELTGTVWEAGGKHYRIMPRLGGEKAGAKEMTKEEVDLYKRAQSADIGKKEADAARLTEQAGYYSRGRTGEYTAREVTDAMKTLYPYGPTKGETQEQMVTEAKRMLDNVKGKPGAKGARDMVGELATELGLTVEEVKKLLKE